VIKNFTFIQKDKKKVLKMSDMKMSATATEHVLDMDVFKHLETEKLPQVYIYIYRHYSINNIY